MLLLPETEFHSIFTKTSEAPAMPSGSLCLNQMMSPNSSLDKTSGIFQTNAYTNVQHDTAPLTVLPPISQHQLKTNHQWDINDSSLPVPEVEDGFELWPSGHARRVYMSDSDDTRLHVSGWAMRNTNNHNAMILKKSCLGVLVCSLDCLLDPRHKVHLRPAICDKARRKQMGKSCPNPSCTGKLNLLSCRGHCGYPVTHFWRHSNGFVYFQAKGFHDHPEPEVKSLSEKGRNAFAKQLRHEMYSVPTLGKRHISSVSDDNRQEKKLFIQTGDDNVCSCPPFECVCSEKSRNKSMITTAAGSHQDVFIPSYSPSSFNCTQTSPLISGSYSHNPSQPVWAHNHGNNNPVTQINITNTCVPSFVNLHKSCSKPEFNLYTQHPRQYFPCGGREIIEQSYFGNNHNQHQSNIPTCVHQEQENTNQSLFEAGKNLPRTIDNHECPSCPDYEYRMRHEKNEVYVDSSGRRYDIHSQDNPDYLYKRNNLGGNTYAEEKYPSYNFEMKPEPREISYSHHTDNVFSPVPSSYNLGPNASINDCKVPTTCLSPDQDSDKSPTYITLSSAKTKEDFNSCRMSHVTRTPTRKFSSCSKSVDPPRGDVTTSNEPLCGSPSTPHSCATNRQIPYYQQHYSCSNVSPGQGTSITPPPAVNMPNVHPGDPYMSQLHHSPGYANSPSMPYGHYYDDLCSNVPLQPYRNPNINITLTITK